MPRTKNDGNPVLGYVPNGCPGCGGRFALQQVNVNGKSPRRGYLYGRCVDTADCGISQLTGEQVQRRWYRDAEWLNGPPEVTPPKVDPASADFDPVRDAPKPTVDEPTAQPTPQPKRTGRLGPALVGVLGLAATAFLALRG